MWWRYDDKQTVHTERLPFEPVSIRYSEMQWRRKLGCCWNVAEKMPLHSNRDFVKSWLSKLFYHQAHDTQTAVEMASSYGRQDGCRVLSSFWWDGHRSMPAIGSCPAPKNICLLGAQFFVIHNLTTNSTARLCKSIAKHTIWTGRMLWIVVDGRSW